MVALALTTLAYVFIGNANAQMSFEYAWKHEINGVIIEQLAPVTQVLASGTLDSLLDDDYRRNGPGRGNGFVEAYG